MLPSSLSWTCAPPLVDLLWCERRELHAGAGLDDVVAERPGRGTSARCRLVAVEGLLRSDRPGRRSRIG